MLKFELESLDGLDDTTKPLYAEKDGKYILQVEGAVSQSKFAEANQKAIDNATEAQRRRRTVERIVGQLGVEDAGEIDSALADLMSGKEKGGKGNEEIVAQLKAEHEAALRERDDRLNGIMMDGARSELKSALMAAKFPEKIADMLAKTNDGRLKLDESGKMRIMKADGGPLAGSGHDGHATFGDLANELAAAMPELIIDSGKGGGGKPPASGSNSPEKTVTRTEFDAMSHLQRADFSKSGGKVVNG